MFTKTTQVRKSMQKKTQEQVIEGKLVNAEQLLEQLFTPESRPSLRWLRAQTQAKSIPFVKWGHFVLFDVEMVRAALASKNLVFGRNY